MSVEDLVVTTARKMKLELENAQLRTRIAELERQARMLREVLQRAGETLLDPPYYERMPDWITEALTQTAKAGERWEAMCKVVEAARDYMEKHKAYKYGDQDRWESQVKLQKALAALERGASE